MELRSDAAAGQTRLDVLTTDCRVKVGHTLVVSRGLPNQELITVSGFGSILTLEALQFFHAAGETVELPQLLPPSSPPPSAPPPSPPKGKQLQPIDDGEGSAVTDVDLPPSSLAAIVVGSTVCLLPP